MFCEPLPNRISCCPDQEKHLKSGDVERSPMYNLGSRKISGCRSPSLSGFYALNRRSRRIHGVGKHSLYYDVHSGVSHVPHCTSSVDSCFIQAMIAYTVCVVSYFRSSL